ncbi:hypothetical protein VD0002_g6427 [Verticillium dahliae]|uniref:Uncharacterized protein n=1 Tax=Verticillium dahliae TaxID=27337 RepID=A0AA44WCE3_VERDA|nr:hypothetical protein VdG2_05302 [Verticillium dahliae VDG2]PNH29054.1 hypothetical protein BJF96_g7593 [Verticillium dahliae]PNH49531.1 hypothetical protein VD0003_g7611 [Verticillium dahliae]PNH61376.1 hypothetical protein VD0002_g6427 [Verticillium dahliae]
MDTRQHETGPLATRTNGRSSLPLVINKGGRKPLFQKPSQESLGGVPYTNDTRPGMARNAYSDGHALAVGSMIPRPGSVSPSPSIASNNSADSASRIPRPSSAAGVFSKARKPISIADAYKMVEAEERRFESAPRTRRLSPLPIDGSPSPAPRPRHSLPASDDGRLRRMLSKGPLDIKKAHPRHADSAVSEDEGGHSADSTSSTGSFERRLSAYAQQQQQRQQQRHSSISPSRRSSLFGNSRIGPKIAETGQTLAKKTSTGSLSGTSPRPAAFAKGHVPKGWVTHLLTREEQKAAAVKEGKSFKEDSADMPLPSVEVEGDKPQEPTPPCSRPTSAIVPKLEGRSPNKDFAWQIEDDFTAGDLQFSDSPRMNLDTLTGDVASRMFANDAAFERNQDVAINTKLDDIRRREREVEEAFAGRDDDLPKNTKLDEIREREKAFTSKKALAASRLDDIREFNMSRSLSPEAAPRPNRQSVVQQPSNNKSPTHRRTLSKDDGERVPNTPVTVYRKPNEREEAKTKNAESAPVVQETPKEVDVPETSRPGLGHTRSDSRDLLRRLARAASTSPAPEARKAAGEAPIEAGAEARTEKLKQQDSGSRPNDKISAEPPVQQASHIKQNPSTAVAQSAPSAKVAEETVSKTKVTEMTNEPRSKAAHSRHSSLDVRKSLAFDREAEEAHSRNASRSRRNSADSKKAPSSEAQDSDKAKPSVNFLGIRRNRSIDSNKGKRTSVALSDNDPTDRIEGEMNLFAPTDNQSERGSVRAPSIEPSSEEDSDDDLVEETPRPLRRDPLSMPTPRITGAYIETPAPVKMEEKETEKVSDLLKEIPQVTGNQDRAPSHQKSSASSSEASRSRSRSKSSGSVHDAQEQAPNYPTSTTSTIRQRARSLPKNRRPLINSVKPPTVKDDLRDIQRTYSLEDSTLDDFEELFKLGRLDNAPSPEIESILNELSSQREELANKPVINEADHSELERYDRITKSLKNGLQNIHAAKQGIERLEDNLAHTDVLDTKKEEPEVDIKPSALALPDFKEERSGDKPSDKLSTKVVHSHKHLDHSDTCPDCLSHPIPRATVSYVHLPLPRLYQTNPFRLSLLGLLVTLFSVWYAAETATCARYCRPEFCSTTPCIYDVNDPTWGTAIPVKLDAALTNGRGRQLYAHLAEEVSDAYLDAWDWINGVDIRHVKMTSLDAYARIQHRRRLHKRGLLKASVVSPQLEAKFSMWHQTRLALEREREMSEAGYVEEEEMVGDDERLY